MSSHLKIAVERKAWSPLPDGLTILSLSMAKSKSPRDTNQPAKPIAELSADDKKNKVQHWGDPHENLNGKHDKNQSDVEKSGREEKKTK